MNKYIYFPEKFLKILGIFNFGIKLSSTVNIIMAITCLGSLWVFAFLDLPGAVNDFGRFVDNFSLLLVGFTGFIKYLALIYSKKTIIELIDLVKSNKINEEESKSEHRSIMDTYGKMGLRFSTAFLWILSGAGVGLVLQPLPGIFLVHQLELPFHAAYPFSLSSTARFAGAFFHQILCVIICILTFVTFDAWVLFMVHHACGHFCVLQNILESIDDVDDQPLQIRRTIIRSIRLHQNIFKFVSGIEDLCNGPNLVQFIASSLSLCVSSYATVTIGLNKPQLLVKHSVVIYGQIVHLFMCNWCGQLIEKTSFEVSLAIARSKWYKLEIDHQKDLGLILLRAQRPAYLTAGKFSILSLPNFSNLMKTSFSYFAVLTSIQED